MVNAPVLKTGLPKGNVGSSPTPTAFVRACSKVASLSPKQTVVGSIPTLHAFLLLKKRKNKNELET